MSLQWLISRVRKPTIKAQNGEDGAGGQEAALRRQKFLRRGKKAAITIRIQKLEKLISEMGSRRMVRGLLNALHKVFDELQEVCHKISLLSEDDDLNCVEMIRLDVDICTTSAMEYLESRANETPSSGSLASSWVEKYGATDQFALEEEGSVYSNQHVMATPTTASEDRPYGIVPDTLERPGSHTSKKEGLQTTQIMEVYGNLLNSDGDSVSSEGNMKKVGNRLDDPGDTGKFKTDISNTAYHIADQAEIVFRSG